MDAEHTPKAKPDVSVAGWLRMGKGPVRSVTRLTNTPRTVWSSFKRRLGKEIIEQDVLEQWH